MRKTTKAIVGYLKKGFAVTSEPIEIKGRPALAILDGSGEAKKAWLFKTKDQAQGVLDNLIPPPIKED